MSIMKDKKQELIGKFKINEKDTGSASVQIAVLTERINNLTGHLGDHKKDFQCRRGLLIMVGTRKKLLKYLRRTDPKEYKKVVEELKIRISVKDNV